MWSPMLAAAAEEWDGDEVLLLIVCGVAAVFGVPLWWGWLAVPKPSWFGWIWQRALVGLLRRGKAGGFGAWVPEPSSG